MVLLIHGSKKVSLLKGISWRIVGTLDTIFLSFLFTGVFSMAMKIGGIELFTKVILYYLHDRFWNYFKIGKREIKREDGVIIIEDKHWKSISKSISWRLIGTLDTVIIAFLITGEFSKAFEIGFTEIFTKMFLFYLHERLWNRITKHTTSAANEKILITTD
jgi:uncharacterized membrane protein